jgi:ERF superfamily protein
MVDTRGKTIMSTAITRVDDAPIESSATAIIQVIERAASNPEVDIDKMERLLQMQERVLERAAEAAFNADLAQMQNELPVIEENGVIRNKSGGVQSTYPLFEDINEACKPILKLYGFAISFRTAFEEGAVIVTGVLSHRQGHRETSSIKLPADASGNKNNVQGWGSSISYGKRYTMNALLNITSRGEDNDGRGSHSDEPSGKPATQAPRSTGGDNRATEAQINLIRGKVERSRIDPDDFLKAFQIEELSQLPFGLVNDALAWIKDNAR